MIKIGITGGIGSGKSVVAQLLSFYGVSVYIADDESKRLTNSSPLIRKPLTDLLGEAVYTEKGLNKPFLASLIFNDKQLLQQVNQIIHPVVADDFDRWCVRQGTPLCAIESAILFESGFDKRVDVRLMVFAPLEVRIGRVAARDQASEAQIMHRIKNQMPDEQKREWADYTILNDGVTPLIPQVEKFLFQFREKFQ